MTRSENDGYREGDEQDVGNDISRAHGDQLRVVLSTLRTRIGHDLPVVAKRLTLGKSGDDNCNESCYEKDANAMQGEFIARTPHLDRDPLEEFGNGPFAHPDEQGVEDAGGQDQLGAEFAVFDLLSSVIDADCGDVVGAVDQDEMHKGHAPKERDQSQEHDPIFPEQLVAPCLSANQAREDDDGSKACCPPAVEEGRVVCETGSTVWRSAGPDRACVEGLRHDYALSMACASSGQRPSCGWLSSPEGVVLAVGGGGMLVAEVEVESREVGIRVWHGVEWVGQSGMNECRRVCRELCRRTGTG